MSDERENVAVELQRIRDAVRDRTLAGAAMTLPAPSPLRSPEAPPNDAPPVPEPPPARPDLAPVNAMWDTSLASPRGGPLGRFARRWLGPLFDSQAAFNSRQVQLDNALVAYLDQRIDQTRRHYDLVLAGHESRLLDVDARHLMLQDELVAQLQDLVKRIDLVLAESERSRLSLEFALRDVRNRLSRIEERLPRG